MKQILLYFILYFYGDPAILIIFWIMDHLGQNRDRPQNFISCVLLIPKAIDPENLTEIRPRCEVSCYMTYEQANAVDR